MKTIKIALVSLSVLIASHVKAEDITFTIPMVAP